MRLLSGTAVPKVSVTVAIAMPLAMLPEIRLLTPDIPTAGFVPVVPPIVLAETPSRSTPDPELLRADVPARFGTDQIALDRVCCLAAPVISMPLPALPEIRLPVPGTLPPIETLIGPKLVDAADMVDVGVSTMKMPSWELASARVPVTSVPMKFAWIVICAAPRPTIWIPCV